MGISGTAAVLVVLVMEAVCGSGTVPGLLLKGIGEVHEMRTHPGGDTVAGSSGGTDDGVHRLDPLPRHEHGLQVERPCEPHEAGQLEVDLARLDPGDMPLRQADPWRSASVG